MGGYSGDVDVIQEKYNKLADVKLELDGCNDNLSGANEEVLATWTGPAANSYRALGERVYEKFQGLNTQLDNLAQLLENAGATYARMEEDAGESFSGGSFAALDD